MFHHGCRMTGSGHVLEPRDDVDQIKNMPCTVAVPRTYGVLKRLERKSTTVKRLTGLWGTSVRFPAESPVSTIANLFSIERTARIQKTRRCDDLRKHQCVPNGSRRVCPCSCPWWLIVSKRESITSERRLLHCCLC